MKNKLIALVMSLLCMMQAEILFAQAVRLSWIPGEDSNLKEYTIYRKSEIEAEFVKINTVNHPGNIYFDHDIQWNHQYFYTITALKTNALESDLSTTIEIPTFFPALGRIKKGDQSHPNEVIFKFPGVTGDLTLQYEIYDIDAEDEVDIFLNDVKIYDVKTTLNNGWSNTRSLLLFDAMLVDSGTNELRFVNIENLTTDKLYYWGVRFITISKATSRLPYSGEVGYFKKGSKINPNEATFAFDGQPGDLSISYEVYDIDHEKELQVLLNGTKIHDEPIAVNNNWSTMRTLLLPDALVHDTGVNMITFDNTQNPPNRWYWGVRNINVAATLKLSVSLDLLTGTNISSKNVRGVESLFDGKIFPEKRVEDDQPLKGSEMKKGLTLIAPDGHLTIAFADLQEFDYFFLYPGEDENTTFSYKIETSQDSKTWQVLVDYSTKQLEGVQLVEVYGTQTFFLKITGASYAVIDREQTDLKMLQSAHRAENSNMEAMDLVLTEFVLYKQNILNNDIPQLPLAFHLSQNFPNPFNPTTKIQFALPNSEYVTITLYNLLGELVQTIVKKRFDGGFYNIPFTATNLTSGIYFYKITAGNFTAVRKMIFTK